MAPLCRQGRTGPVIDQLVGQSRQYHLPVLWGRLPGYTADSRVALGGWLMDPNPDYDASDEIEYGIAWWAWILRNATYPPPAYPPV